MIRASFISTKTRSLVLAGILAVSTGFMASAQQLSGPPLMPSHLTVATDVLRNSGLMTMFTNSMPNAIGSLRANVTRTRPELAKEIEESLKTVEAEIPTVIDEGVAGASRFLASKMTEAELKEVLAFLNSAAGKKYVTTLPAFMDEVMPYLQVWTQAAGQAITRRFTEEMGKRGHKL